MRMLKNVYLVDSLCKSLSCREMVLIWLLKMSKPLQFILPQWLTISLTGWSTMNSCWQRDTTLEISLPSKANIYLKLILIISIQLELNTLILAETSRSLNGKSSKNVGNSNNNNRRLSQLVDAQEMKRKKKEKVDLCRQIGVSFFNEKIPLI